MISRDTATRILKQAEYELWFVSPNRRAFFEGKRIPVYFTVGPHKWYPVGNGEQIELYIAPFHDIEYPDLIARRIGYRGTVRLFSRNGDPYR